MKDREELQLGFLGAVTLFFLFLIFFRAEFAVSAPLEIYNVSNNVNYVEEYKSDNPVNINTATAEMLIELEDIGETLAARIVEYRKANGDFKCIEDLANVKGISETMVEKLRPYICT